MNALGGLGTCFFLEPKYSGLGGFGARGGVSTGGIHRTCSSDNGVGGVRGVCEGWGDSTGGNVGIAGGAMMYGWLRGEDRQGNVADDHSFAAVYSESASDADSGEGEGLG